MKRIENVSISCYAVEFLFSVHEKSVTHVTHLPKEEQGTLKITNYELKITRSARGLYPIAFVLFSFFDMYDLTSKASVGG
jgi:hypothetical protein